MHGLTYVWDLLEGMSQKSEIFCNFVVLAWQWHRAIFSSTFLNSLKFFNIKNKYIEFRKKKKETVTATTKRIESMTIYSQGWRHSCLVYYTYLSISIGILQFLRTRVCLDQVTFYLNWIFYIIFMHSCFIDYKRLRG